MKLFPRWNYELELWELYGRQDRKGRGRVAGTYARRKMGHATLIMTCNRDPKKKASHARRPFPTVSFYCCCCCCCCDVACCTLLVARCTLHGVPSADSFSLLTFGIACRKCWQPQLDATDQGRCNRNGNSSQSQSPSTALPAHTLLLIFHSASRAAPMT